jgi:hypothetical protein
LRNKNMGRRTSASAPQHTRTSARMHFSLHKCSSAGRAVRKLGRRALCSLPLHIPNCRVANAGPRSPVGGSAIRRAPFRQRLSSLQAPAACSLHLTGPAAEQERKPLRRGAARCCSGDPHCDATALVCAASLAAHSHI